MAYTPNYDCANFCYWMLNLSWQRLTGPQTVLITTVYNAALAQTSVTDQQWKDFTMVSSWRSKYYEAWGKYSSYYNTLCQNWLNYLPSVPSPWYTSIVNQFFQDLIDAGIDSQLDRLWLFTGASEGISLISLINPNATPASNGTLTTFTPYQGYTGNGSSMFIDLNFNGFSQGVNYTLNSASIGVYCRKQASSASGDCVIAAQSGSSYTLIQPRFTLSTFRTQLNSGTFPSPPANTNTRGMMAITRNNASNSVSYLNGSAMATVANPSLAVPNSTTTVLARVGSDFSSNQASLAFVGSGSINQVQFYSIIQTFMTRVGCQV